MKISQIPSVASSAATDSAKVESVRNIKLKVNQTPEPAILAPQEVAPVEENKEPQEETNAVTEATEPLSPQFAALAKQRRVLQQERRAFQDEKKAFEAAKSQGGDSVPLARLKSEPLKVLLEHGVTYDQLTEALLSNQHNPEIYALQAKIADLEKGVDTKLTERDNQARQQVIAEMRRNADQLVTNGDDFSLVREMRAVPQVIKLIERTYDESGEILDVADACKLVEDHLFEQQQKLVKLKKVQGLYAPAEQPIIPQQRPAMRTLTNKDTASIPMGRRERAIAAAYGTLRR